MSFQEQRNEAKILGMREEGKGKKGGVCAAIKRKAWKRRGSER